ncbi:hypothetical protein QR680_007933 [Steinernema hermaphroditum]|uniref:Serpentine receptor class gamma n=1 Tax=Steinernema hermaphroditum TaxID=289476 RepID=A0AA39M645_9BILA|nr:hypothetical protein QR680_007933 [Steinernema hermaphroditum]
MIPLHFEIAYLSIGIPSLIFYVIVIVSLLKKSNKETFGLPFYRIFAVICVVDCINYVVNTVSFRIPMCPTFSSLYVDSQSSILTNILHFGLFFCGYFVIFGQSLITINRFSAVAFPLKHQKFWRKYHLHGIGVALSLALACSGHTAFAGAWFIRHDIEGTKEYFLTLFMSDIIVTVFGKPMMLSSVIAAVMSTFGTCFQLTLNSTAMILLIRRRKKTGASTSGNKVSKVELNLFFLSVAMFLVGLSSTFYNIGAAAIIFMQSAAIVPFVDHYLWVADLNNLSAPYLLFMVSASARRTVLEAIGLKKKSGGSVLFSKTNSSSTQVS